MAVLVDAKRREVWSEIMDVLSTDRAVVAVNKTVLRDAVNAADAWVEANKVSFNVALPLAAQTGLSAPQKAALLLFVVQKRFFEGS